MIVQIPTALLVSALADRSEDRRPWLTLTLAITILGLVFVGFIPLATPWVPWVWAVMLGIGTGGLFPLSLTLPLDNSADAGEASRLTAMTFFVGFLLAAIGPFAAGALHDVTGDYSVSFIALAALGIGMLAILYCFRPRSVRNGRRR
jgi:CP family cyanate transporter-like MFS transporter